MSKIITSHSLQLVTFTTSTPVSEVIQRLEEEIGKPGTPIPLGLATGVTSRAEFEARVKIVLGPSGFLYFNEFSHDRWLQHYSPTPRVIVYVFGNPLIAQTILQHDLHAALDIPPRLLVLEKPDVGTEIVYHLPSSVMALGDSPQLKAAVEALDDALERMVTRVLAIEPQRNDWLAKI
ncbi:hypothetical protein C8J57DRAFT_1462695 [Mycena rebaudengoi]|nr:hypothetical protein C8J57DRAFT_1462695 [Mycena rebaudengoi]